MIAKKKKPFRTEESYAFERRARDAVAPFLRSRGIEVLEDFRRTVGRGQSQQVRVRLHDGNEAFIRVRLCWRRDGHDRNESLFSAAQLAANTNGAGGLRTLENLTQRDLDAGITHSLFFQRDTKAEVHAALVPTDAVPRIWQRQFEVSAELIAQGRLGRQRKNHAANGDSPTIWLQDDRAEDSHLVSDVLWSWPGVTDLMALPSADEAAGRAKYWRVLDALQRLGRPSTVAEVISWLEKNAPPADYSDTRENLTLLTVNDANRRHYDSSRSVFRSDLGHPRDAVFRSNQGRNVRYEPYSLARHGAYDIVEGAAGAFRVVKVAPADLAKAYASAQAEVEVASDPIRSMDDARARMLRAVVIRRGQREFRDRLLRAYGGRCAISGCAVVDVLEAAHIVPYLGDQTQRTDNGLLLRTDLHTLFDLGRLWIDAGMRVRLASELIDSEYAALEGRSLSLPRDRSAWPHPHHLSEHRRICGR